MAPDGGPIFTAVSKRELDKDERSWAGHGMTPTGVIPGPVDAQRMRAVPLSRRSAGWYDHFPFPSLEAS